MKVLVIKTFIDRIDDILYKSGDEIEVTKERCGEINATSLFVEEIKKPKK
jgi:hypothetical protein